MSIVVAIARTIATSWSAPRTHVRVALTAERAISCFAAPDLRIGR
jgi:hypothetical protein